MTGDDSVVAGDGAPDPQNPPAPGEDGAAASATHGEDTELLSTPGEGSDSTAPATPGEDTEPGEDTDLLSTLEAVTSERNDYLDKWQRVSAEFANFRKQTEKRNADFAAQAGSRVAEALLPVLDAFDAAVQQGVEGVEPIGGQLRSVLQSAGLEVIADEAEPFDPNRHEAAMSEPGDDGQDVALVAEVLRTGYAWNGRILRAAMVRVKG